MQQELISMFKSLSNYFSGERMVASEEEIIHAVKGEIRKLDPEKRKNLEDWLGGNLEQLIFNSIVHNPISIFCPHMCGRRNYLGETFYHNPNHAYPMAGLESAYKRLIKLRSSETLAGMEKVLGDFLNGSGYKISSVSDKDQPTEHKQIAAARNGWQFLLYLIPSIGAAPEYSELPPVGGEQVLVVPTEKTPAPFIRFSRDFLGSFEGKNIQVWVVNVEGGFVNPFFGFPRDEELANNFENPKQSLLAAQVYRQRKMPRITHED